MRIPRKERRVAGIFQYLAKTASLNGKRTLYTLRFGSVWVRRWGLKELYKWKIGMAFDFQYGNMKQCTSTTSSSLAATSQMDVLAP